MLIIDILKSVLLGIVEGITEWLPISSTGHLILVNSFLGTDKGFFDSQIFLYVIQLGAILAIATLYFRKLNPFALSKTEEEKIQRTIQGFCEKNCFWYELYDDRSRESEHNFIRHSDSRDGWRCDGVLQTITEDKAYKHEGKALYRY